MTNNQLCELLEAASCAIVFVCVTLMFFGAEAAVWGAALGGVLGVLGLLNHD